MTLDDPELLIRWILKNEIRLELLNLFRKNPELTESVEGLARRLGRDVAIVKPHVHDFVEIGLVTETREEGGKVFSLAFRASERIEQGVLARIFRIRTE